MNERRKTVCSQLLLLTAFIWGMVFVSQSKGMDYMGPLTSHGVRSLVGALVLLFYLFLRNKIRGGQAEKVDRGITIKAGKAGFITTLYIIFVPIPVS